MSGSSVSPADNMIDVGMSDALKQWLAGLSLVITEIQPLSVDASSRCYWRVITNDQSYVCMDAGPERDTCGAFVSIAQTWSQLDLQVPTIHCQELTQGFLLISDLGDQCYDHMLKVHEPDVYYQNAMQSLLTIAQCEDISGYALPSYDAGLLLLEMGYFREWYLEQYCDYHLSDVEEAALRECYQRLVELILTQPFVCVHRDYHSRNLLVLPQQQVGILDFQGALRGPVTYDLVSLLRDCYLEWPAEQVTQWALSYQQQALAAGMLQQDDPELFMQWFDWTGVQRHLKCLGLFARLHLRDKKSRYLSAMPCVLGYLNAVCSRYPELQPIPELLRKLVS